MAAAGDERDGTGRRCGRCPGPLSYAAASLACIVAAIAVFESHWLLGEPARTAAAGALMAVSVALAFAVVLSAAVAATTPLPPPSPPQPAAGRRPDAARAPAADADAAAGRPSAGTILSVFAVATVAAIALAAASTASYAPHQQYPAGHIGIVPALAACHATDEGCGRAAIGGDSGSQAHLLAPPPVITTLGVPAVVPISGMLPADARPPARVGLVVEGPAGSPDGARDEYSVMSTTSGRYSLHPSILPPSPGTHVYTVSASYGSRDIGAAVDAGTASFTVMVLQPEISRSVPSTAGPLLGLLPEDVARMGEGGGAADGGPDHAAPHVPPRIVDGMVSFAPPPPTVSVGQVVRISFEYVDGVPPRDSSAYVRGPDHARLTEPAYAGSGGGGGGGDAARPPGSYTFVVQPTWTPGTYGVVVAFGGGNDPPTASTAGVLPIAVAVGAPPLNRTVLEEGDFDSPALPFTCIVPFGRVGPGAPVDPEAEPVQHGRPGGCYAGTVRGTAGPDALDIDGRPVTLTISNARTVRDAVAEDASARLLGALCPAGSIALVDRDDTLAVDGREPSPTVRAGYYSAVWCLGTSGGAYDGSAHVPVNRILMAEGHAEPDPIGCLSSEYRLEWDECDAYTAVEQAVGGAISTAIGAVSTAAGSAIGGGDDDNGGGGGGGTPGVSDPEDGGGGGDCAIATAAYGTPAAAHIQALREYRDSAMGGPEFGAFHAEALLALALEPATSAYYAASPPVADMLRDSPAARHAAASLMAGPAALAAALATHPVHGSAWAGGEVAYSSPRPPPSP